MVKASIIEPSPDCKADDIPNGNIVSAIGSKADMSSAIYSIPTSAENVNNESDDVQYSVGLTDTEDFDTKAFAGELINKFGESLNHRTVP